MFKGKTIILGVTGGIAVYKAVELLRLLTKGGATVHVIMTRAACEFVTPLTFQTLSQNPVHTELFSLISEQEIGHIALADRADLFIIAPATANVIGKIANGLADDLLTTTVMATKAPVLVAPAMNVNMYQNPLYRINEEKLRQHGYHLLQPVKGELACGWQGEGKLPDPAVILEAAIGILSPKDLAGERVLVTAGPTREEIDPVRFLSNHSSGKMGFALATAARRRGAHVTLVSGPTALPDPWGVEVVRVTSAKEMREAVLAHYEDSTVVLKSAAVADFRPRSRAGSKVKKGEGVPLLELVPNPDILAELGKQKERQFLVGFAAETDNLDRYASHKLQEKNLDMVVANDVSQEGAGFNVDTNIVTLFFRDGTNERLPQLPKGEVAERILDRIAQRLSKGN
ncbi:MAG TPA: bifunctional phosphopantothenoylcysteine decarboxylase/phosphopantothenate--cysteine ligase CoaBC [Geobacterales bacterium]|nr:bifunctional phosphopantothenoylcysteine decarboxylase/phosphopantothenate--cysteine ligase CoaBC [Geobacterales bacterium]